MSKNIYQMYHDNGDTAGFFVRRDSWSTIIAKVVSIDGQESGELPGKPPYHGNPPVLMTVYNNDGTIQKEAETMSCPGTYAYSQIDPPFDLNE
ncbi:hypothetical protein FHS27_004770 [Rhodopirellula rubra]|uniref:Uncharacterized protein n=1 Tax=Aporhodopirellula rubra TaxID=980271 RepID=A0A7W5E2F5_9BACT|nr:hypothetical protein [Aporhodopirellula rubra]MBB3208936.1 hypothetical protein [Aporhodopirellula rubra]